MKSEDLRIYNADAISKMRELPDNSIDMVLCDPPYGTTSIKWDSVIPFGEVWEELNRITKEGSNIIFFGSQPFTSKLICSKEKWFKYELVWNKNKCGSPGLAKIRPLKVHENIIVFTKDGKRAKYNPIMETGDPYERNCSTEDGYGSGRNTHGYGFGDKEKNKVMRLSNSGTRYPKSILHASRNFSAQQTVHPTQKPTNILNWLVMTYSDPGDVVLDFTMGSGSTGVSCKMTGRKFVGIEKDENYFNVAKDRIDKCVALVEREDHQLTTQIHKEMKTTPDKKHEKEYYDNIQKKETRC